MGEPVALNLSGDEALVLFEWIHRFNNTEQVFEDQAEQRVLWNIECLLEKALAEPFDPAYATLLQMARDRVRDVTE